MSRPRPHTELMLTLCILYEVIHSSKKSAMYAFWINSKHMDFHKQCTWQCFIALSVEL